MSYGFDMAFAHVVDEKAALCLARSYVDKCMEKENAGKFIEQNKMYIPSVRYDYIAEKERTMANMADEFWLESLFKFRFLYWPKYQLLGIIGNSIDKNMFPMEMYFQNSTDQDYDFQNWLEGDIPFFRENVEFIKDMPLEKLQDVWFDKDADWSNMEIETYARESLLYSRIFQALEFNAWLYADESDKEVSWKMFSLSGIQKPFERMLLCNILRCIRQSARS